MPHWQLSLAPAVVLLTDHLVAVPTKCQLKIPSVIPNFSLDITILGPIRGIWSNP